MTILTVFRSHLANSQYAFKNGKMAHFIALGDKPAQFMTSVEAEIKELLAEIHIGHPHIYVPAKTEEQTVDTEFDPIAELKAKLRAEVMAELNAVPTSGRSSTTNKPVLGGMVTSASIAGATAENVKTVPLVVDSGTGTKETDPVAPVDPVDPVTDPIPPVDPTASKLALTDKLAALKAGKSGE